MEYFSRYSLVNYIFDSAKPGSQTVINILNSAKFVDVMPERSSKCYVDYIVKDGEKPEHISDRVYRRPDYHWVVLMANKIYNPYWDWPMSVDQMDRYLESKYPGSALFYECLGSGAVNFTQSGTSTLLTAEESNFVVGNTLTQVKSNIITVTGTIIEWNPTYRKLVVDNVAGGAFSKNIATTSVNSRGKTFTVTPKRVVQTNQEAVHHFVDDFNNQLDPYAKINYYEYDDNKIFARYNIFYNNRDGLPTSTTIGATGSNDFILNKYINGSQDNAITNRRNAEIENDVKRAVKILRPEYVPNVVKQFETLFK